MAGFTDQPCRKCGDLTFRNDSGKVYCKTCKARMARERRERDPEAEAARRHANYERNKERHTARTRAYYQANREAYYRTTREWQAANRAKVLGYKRKWSQAHPEKGIEYAQKRRALKLAAVCEHGVDCVTAEIIKSVSGQMCVYCGAVAEHADHYIPLARGGLHCRTNIVPACAWCNKSKNKLLPDEWRAALAKVG